MGDITYTDLYSCFPISVFNICDGLDLNTDDPGTLTVTGGLPYFGGAGNNYSMHAIAQIARKLRGRPETCGFVGANGGMLSKYSAGVYSARPARFKVCNRAALQRRINARAAPEICDQAHGKAFIETYTIVYNRGIPRTAIVVARLKANNARIMANAETERVLQSMVKEDPLGAEIGLQSTSRGNRFDV
jgi:acetyl-CoA C-acetyltransferase